MPPEGEGDRPVVPGAISALLEELARTPLAGPGEVLHPEPIPGDVLGRFELLRVIGRGGFGVVYEARDRDLGRLVALKAIRAGAASAAELRKESLRHEAEAAAQLSHPNIVTLHDFGVADGVPYLILELLRGETLQERLGLGPLSPAEAIAIVRDAARAVAHAHATGVVHRDLKPSNVFLTRDGRVKVLDFGLAYMFGGRVPLRGGTRPYMAPEARRGEQVDERADVFALGVIVHRALTGELPADGKPVDAACPLPGPRALGQLVASMLAVDPARRPRDGGAVLTALEDIERQLVERPSPRAGGREGSAARRVAAAVAVAAIASALIAGVVVRGRAERRMLREGAAPATSSVAVLPFVDLSPDRDQAYFAEGLSEEILNALANVPGLRVVGRTSSFALQGRDDVRTIGQKLRVGSVLEGSVRKSGARLRITAQLVSTTDGVHLWSRSFEREIGDVFAIQDEIAGAVVNALDIALRPGDGPSTAHHRTSDPEVYRLYLLGRHFWNRLAQRENNLRAVKAYEAALALEASYAPAWAGLAAAEFAAGNDAHTAASEMAACRRGREAAERAISLDPELAEPYSTRALLGMWCRWDWPGARADLDQALSFAPHDIDALRRDGILRLLIGRTAEAVAALRKAADADPLVPLSWRWVGFAELSAGRVDGAREALSRALELAPGDPYASYLLALAHLLDHQPARAIEVANRSLEPDDPDCLTALAMAHHDLGQVEAERRAVERLRAKDARGNTSVPCDLARYHAWLGQRDRAFEALDRAYQRHDLDVGAVRADPILAVLRGDDRYAALLRKMAIPADP